MENQDLTQLSKLDYILKERPNASQRDIAKAIGMSLGMTNSLLKRFSDKGYLYLKKNLPTEYTIHTYACRYE